MKFFFSPIHEPECWFNRFTKDTVMGASTVLKGYYTNTTWKRRLMVTHDESLVNVISQNVFQGIHVGQNFGNHLNLIAELSDDHCWGRIL